LPPRGYRRGPCGGRGAIGQQRALPGRGLHCASALEGRVPRMTARRGAMTLALLLAITAGPAAAGEVAGADAAVDAATPAATPVEVAVIPAPTRTTNGLTIYERFVGGLAQPECTDASPRWRKHFAHVPNQLTAG